jgi:DNA primase
MIAVRSMVEIALQAETQVAREDYLQQISLLLGVQPDAIRSEVAILEKRRSHAGREAPAPAPVAGPDAHTKGYEEHLLYICLHNEPILRELSMHLVHEWIDTANLSGQLLDRLLAEVQHNGWNGQESLEQLIESEEERALVASMLFQASGDEDWVKIANEGLRHLQKRFLEPRKQQIELEIASKGAIGDPTLPSLLKQRAEITRQLLNPPRLSLAS